MEYRSILCDTPSSICKYRLPLTGNICDHRLWRIKGASVGVAVDFVRRSKPHYKIGYRKRAIGGTPQACRKERKQ